MSLYEGTRTKAGLIVTVNGELLDPRNDLVNHSPDGFEWGYGGSGPAQLSLAILADHFGDDEKALAIYQEFKFLVIANLPYHRWTLTSGEIIRAIESMARLKGGLHGL